MSIRQLASEIASFDSSELSRSALIIKHTQESATGLLHAFDVIKRARNATRGAATDEEQDLLRAMLVFAAAGLDSMLKQLIADALPVLIQCDLKAKLGLEGFIRKQLKSRADESSPHEANKFLARVLSATSQQVQVIAEYVESLSANSLQSPEMLAGAVSALGLDPREVGLEFDALRPIFAARNNIIHELDIDFEAARRNRRSRRKTVMVDFTNKLIELSERIIIGVKKKID